MKKLLIVMALVAFTVPTAAYAANFGIGIQEFQFLPPNLTITVGDSVTWTNNGTMSHTSTSGGNCVPDGIWDAGLIPPGQTFTRVFSAPGTFPFHCSVMYHCSVYGMQGTITVNPPAAVLPLPSGALVVPAYGSIVSSVLSADATQAMPISVGSVAQGGGTVTVQVQTDPIAGPADVYFAISAPAIDPVNIYLLTPAGAQTLASAGLVPWMTGVLGINAVPFGNIPVSLLPQGTYNLLLAITPSGSLSSFDFWQTSFTVSPPPVVTPPYPY